MKLTTTILVFTLFATTVFGQSRGNKIQLSHNITTETKNITGFDKIDVSEDFIVFIRFSNEEESVKIEANENLHNWIQVEKEGGTLKISTKSYNTGGSDSKGEAKERLIAYITAKNLIEIRGDEDVSIKLEDKLVTDNLNIHLDEDSTLEGHLEVQNLVVELDEDSVLDIKGSAQTMEVEISEDSMLSGFDFIVGNLSIDLSGDSAAKLTVNGDINLSASGESLFQNRGEGAYTKKHLTGDSEVKSW